MIPGQFDYARPGNLDEALDRYAGWGASGRPPSARLLGRPADV